MTSHRLYGRAGRYLLGSLALLALAMAIGASRLGGAGAIFLALGLIGVADARKFARSARRFRVGAAAEERVAERISDLPLLGWVVMHDVQKEGGGNLDHLVHSPGTTYVIDTKARRWRHGDIDQAHRHVAWAARRYGRRDRHVVPIICIEAGDCRTQLLDGVYIVAASNLRDFLLDRG